MKLRSLFLLSLLLATVAAQTPSDAPRVFWDGATIPNPVLRTYVLEHYDADKNGVISKQEARDVDRIEIGFNQPSDSVNVPRTDVHSLKGIERFPNLTHLSCWVVGLLTSLDLSKNKSLQYVDLNYYQGGLDRFLAPRPGEVYAEGLGETPLLLSLRLPQTPTLEELYCQGGLLTSLDVSECSNLRVLVCYKNKLTSLDVSGCPNLKRLECGENKLTSLDVSCSTALERLGCSGNRIGRLDLTANRVLKILHCDGNPLTTLRLPSSLTALGFGTPAMPLFDLSKYPGLDYICAYNQTSLDLSKNPALKTLILTNCKLDKLDLSHNLEMKTLSATTSNGNEILEVDLRYIRNLENIYGPDGSRYYWSDDAYDWSGSAAKIKSEWRQKELRKRAYELRDKIRDEERETEARAEAERQKAEAERLRQEQRRAVAGDFALLKRQAVQAAAKGDWEQAENKAFEANKLINDDAYIHMLLTESYYNRSIRLDDLNDKDVGATFKAYRSEAQRLVNMASKSIRLDGSSSNKAYFWRGIGYIVLGRGNCSNAVADFRRYMQGVPQEKGRCYYNIGIAYKNSENYRDALEAFKLARANTSNEKINKDAMKRIIECQKAIDGK